MHILKQPAEMVLFSPIEHPKEPSQTYSKTEIVTWEETSSCSRFKPANSTLSFCISACLSHGPTRCYSCSASQWKLCCTLVTWVASSCTSWQYFRVSRFVAIHAKHPVQLAVWGRVIFKYTCLGVISNKVWHFIAWCRTSIGSGTFYQQEIICSVNLEFFMKAGTTEGPAEALFKQVASSPTFSNKVIDQT